MNALVTGGTRGIGRGIVQKLLEAGHRVGFCGRGQYAGGALPENAAFFQCDIADVQQQEAMLEAYEARFGAVELLVNNAGVAPAVRADLLEMSRESFDRVLAINLAGPFFLTQKVARRMVAAAQRETPAERRFRAIVNIGSVSADYASINRGEYCLSKAAVAMATKLFAVRLADDNIAVYELRPGVIKSDMTSVVSAKYDRMIADGLTLQRRWGTPEDVGRAVAMLASGALAYSTGQVIAIDGGLSVERF